MKATFVAAAIALAVGCGGRQMLDLPAADGGAGRSGGGAGSSGSAGAGSAGTLGDTGSAGAVGVVGSAGTFGDTGGAGTFGFAGTTGTAGTTASAYMVAPVDYTSAMPTFSMTCEGDFGDITFVGPCLVGDSLSSHDPTVPGVHEVECNSVPAQGGGIGWSFLVTLPPVQNPQTLLIVSGTNQFVRTTTGKEARASTISGQLTFYVVDPTNLAFEADFQGVVTWVEPSGDSFQCKLFSTLWGAPGGFN
jgi:hypothetical protein